MKLSQSLLQFKLWVQRYFCSTGLLVGTLLFALSLTPTLLPRTNNIQGVISGLALAVGYGIGVCGRWLWSYFELPKPKKQVRHITQLIATFICLLFAMIFMWRASGWQQALWTLIDMDGDGVQPFVIGVVALLVFISVLLAARMFTWTCRSVSRKLQRIAPRRVSNVFGLLIAISLFWSVVNGVLFSWILHLADTSYEEIDSLLEPEFARPMNPMKAGSPESLLVWEDMGRQGRRFLSRGPTTAELQQFSETPVLEPIRVYVGMHAAESFQERAALALEELKRVKAFDCSILVLITPTGTGWVDPNAIAPLEYLYRGDVASVAAQYSYLPSVLSLLLENEYGAGMARALFQAVYGHWTTLPKHERPRLYLYGLSLGAMNSDHSFDFFDIIEDPFHGALWSGPPFRMSTWHTVTEQRNPDSPAWKPRFRDGSVVRFANQDGGLDEAEAEWGSFRIAILQYASDPFTFFSPQSATREPDWMKAPRGPDVSQDLRWFPIITMLQLAADMVAGTTPDGYGHRYAVEHYLNCWYALTEPEGWDAERLTRLRTFLAATE